MNYPDPQTVPPVWEIGDVILDKYEVRQVFTGGGMGLVYRVYHRDWNLDLAVKSPRAEFFQSVDHLESFEQEAETWVNLGLHPQIACCHYVRRLGGIPRIFAEYVSGGSLSDNIALGKFHDSSPQENLAHILDAAIQFAWGIQYAHENGLIHLDIKPGNALMSSGGILKVTDFGLAKARGNIQSMDSSDVTGRTVYIRGSGYMTPAYASPEQANGEAVSTKTDIWSWGVSVLELMKGEVDWSYGQTAIHVLEAYYAESFAHDPIANLLANCFSRDSSNRPSAEECARTLIDIFEKYFERKYDKEYSKKKFLTSDSFNNRGLSLLDLGREDEGIRELEEALKRNANNINANYNLQIAKWRQGKISDESVIRELWGCRNSQNSPLIDKHINNVNIERGISRNALKITPNTEEGILALGLENLIPLNGSVIYTATRHSASGHEFLSVTISGGVYIHNDKGETTFATNLDVNILACDLTSDWSILIYATKETDGVFINRFPIFNQAENTFLKKIYSKVKSFYCLNILDSSTFFTSADDNIVLLRNISDFAIQDKIDLSNPDSLEIVANGYPFCSSVKYCPASGGFRPPTQQETKDEILMRIKVWCAVRMQKRNTLVIVHSEGVRFWEKDTQEHNLSPFSLPDYKSGFPHYKTTKVLKSPVDNTGSGRVAVSMCGNFLVYGHWHPVLFDKDGDYIRTFCSEGRRIESLHFTPSSKHVYGITYNGSIDNAKYRTCIMIWRVDSGQLVRTIPLDSKVCLEKMISLIGNGEGFFVGLSSGLLQYGHHDPNPSAAPYIVSRPVSTLEIDRADLVLFHDLAAAKSSIEKKDYIQALSIVRSLQSNNNNIRHVEVQDLESKLNLIGFKMCILSVVLECDLSIHIKEKYLNDLKEHHSGLVNETIYEKHFNAEGTQVLWFTLSDKTSFDDALLFDVKSGIMIANSTINRQLWRHGGTGVWCIAHELFGSGELSYINCQKRILTHLKKTGHEKLYFSDVAADKNTILTTSCDANVVWDACKARCISTLVHKDKYFRSRGCFSTSGQNIILATGASDLARYDLRKTFFKSMRLKLTKRFKTILTSDLKSRSRYLAVVDNESKLIHAARDGLECFLYETGVHMFYIKDSGISAICSVGVSPLLIVGYETGMLSLIDTHAGVKMFDLAKINSPIHSIKVTSDSLRIVVNCQFIYHLLWSYTFPDP
jgi:serine/threonine protein kinase